MKLFPVIFHEAFVHHPSDALASHGISGCGRADDTVSDKRSCRVHIYRMGLSVCKRPVHTVRLFTHIKDESIALRSELEGVHKPETVVMQLADYHVFIYIGTVIGKLSFSDQIVVDDYEPSFVPQGMPYASHKAVSFGIGKCRIDIVVQRTDIDYIHLNFR